MIERLLLLISEKVERHKILVLVIGIGIGIISGLYTIKNCKINTNTEDLLSNKLEWRIDYEKFKSAFPNLTDNVLIVIKSPIPESAQKALAASPVTSTVMAATGPWGMGAPAPASRHNLPEGKFVSH